MVDQNLINLVHLGLGLGTTALILYGLNKIYKEEQSRKNPTLDKFIKDYKVEPLSKRQR